MPPTTRSRGKAPAAPASRVYHSSPAPGQVEFPARRRALKTYHRKPQSARSLRQSTLTQIGYVDSSPLQELEMSPTKEGRSNKRRKTMGDAPNSSLHTQTLTQLISELDKDEVDENLLLLSDHEEEDGGLEEVKDSEHRDAKRRGKRKADVPEKAPSHVTDSQATSMIPQTPAGQKRTTNVYEVPSSQPTPTTPWDDLPRFRIQPYRSPLIEKTTNVNAPPPNLETVSKRPRDLVIQDSYSSAGFLSSDPAQTPGKASQSTSALPLSAPRQSSTELGEPASKSRPGTGRSPPDDVPMINNRRVLGEIAIPAIPDREIPDSDEELDSLGPTPIKRADSATPFTPHRAVNASRAHPAQTTPTITAAEEEHALGCSDEDLDPGSPTPMARRVQSDPRPSQIELAVPQHTHLGPEAELPSQIPRHFHEDPGLGKLRTIAREHVESLNQAPRDRISVFGTWYTTRLGPFHPRDQIVPVDSDEPLVPSERPVQGRGRVPSLLGSFSGTQGRMSGPAIYSINPVPPPSSSYRPVYNQAPQPNTAFPSSYSVPRGPPEVIEILDDTPTASPHSPPQDETTAAPRRASPHQSSPPLSLKLETEEAPDVSSHESSQEQVPDTPVQRRRVRIELPESSTEGEAVEDTLPTSPHQSSYTQSLAQPTQARSQYYSQGLESQRVPLEIIRSMAPQTDRSDIIISIHPENVDLIASGHKTHEFRSYRIPGQVSRFWIYVTAPVCELKYMAATGPAKEPGEIDNNGTGNAEFNDRKGAQFAYELLQIYQINNPVPLAKMKERGYVKGSAPQKYQYVPPAVVGELLGNLRCALFDTQWQHDEHESELEPQGGPTVSQEIEHQLRSDIILATSQAQPVAAAEETQDAVPLSSQSELPPVVPSSPVTILKSDDVFARPQAPASRILSQVLKTPSRTRFGRREDYDPVRPSQATTASEPSSPVISPEKSMPIQRPFLASSGPSFPDFVEETQFSPLRRTQHQQLSDLGSSQVIGLPNSLLVDTVRPPPAIIWDSEEEEDGIV